MPPSLLFLVGQMLYDEHGWSFQGIFDSENLAIKACRDANYFYTAVSMNEELPHETTVMADACFPIRNVVVKTGDE